MAKSGLPLLIGAAAAVFLLGKKGGGTAGDSTGSGDDSTGNGNGSDDGTGNGGGGVGQIGGIKGAGELGPNSWKFCGASSGSQKSAYNANGVCTVFWNSAKREQLAQKLAVEYSALDAGDKTAICAATGADHPPARIAFVSDITKEFWPELDRPDVVFPPKAGALSGRDFPKYAYERVLGLVLTNHCGFAN